MHALPCPSLSRGGIWIRKITHLHWMNVYLSGLAHFVFLIRIRWIVICPVDSAIQHLNLTGAKRVDSQKDRVFELTL